LTLALSNVELCLANETNTEIAICASDDRKTQITEIIHALLRHSGMKKH